jgi:hypothetical protein
MHYAYGEFCPDWDESKKYILAERLCELLKEFGVRYVSGYSPGWLPYIEVDGLYKVSIRRITHMPNFKRNQLVKKADQIYEEVMVEKTK